jgi:hypothetical protein
MIFFENYDVAVGTTAVRFGRSSTKQQASPESFMGKTSNH